jgi:hypothetical protein
VSILITGMPRGATGYASLVFKAAGLHVEHEAMGRDGISTGFVGMPSPGLGTLVLWSQFSLVLHQIREPRYVVSSLAIEPERIYSPLWEAVGKPPCQGIEALLWTYVQIHARAYKMADYTFKVEDYPQAWQRIRSLVPRLLGPFPSGIRTDVGRRYPAARENYRLLEAEELRALSPDLCAEAYDMWACA